MVGVSDLSPQSREAKEVWLTLDVKDHVTECCEWAEVSSVYVLSIHSWLRAHTKLSC